MAQGRTITGLLPDTLYQVRVRATGVSDPSQWSVVVPASTLTGPDAPAIQLAERDGGTIVIGWNQANARGTTIQTYELRYRKNDVDTWTSYGGAFSVTPPLRITLSGLEPATEYRIQMRAVPNVGVGSLGHA